MNIASLAIKRPVFIVMIVLSIITLGIIGYVNLPVDLLPSIDMPNVMVITSYPGASSVEIENSLSKPLENAVGTIEGLDTLTSISREGISRVIVQFKMGVDIKYSEMKVREKILTAVSQLPTSVQNAIQQPVIRRFSSDDMPIIFMSVKGNRELSQLRDILENTIQPQIESVSGVGAVSIFGARKSQVQVVFNKALMSAAGVNYQQIQAAIAKKNISYPSGEIDGKLKNITVRVYGKFDTLDDIGNVTLTSASGKVIRVRDIAKVDWGLEDESSRARVNGEPAVLFAVFKQSGGNTVAVVQDVMKKLPDILKIVPSDVKINVVRDTSVSIQRSVRGVQQDILFGAVLAIIIVWLFLGNFRSTMITAIALPNSLLGAFFLVWGANFSINTITLMSLSLCVGLLIDDSIVVRENIFRYIEQGMDPKKAAEKGTNEVALAVLSTTLSIMAVFIPISFLSGMIGQFLRQFGLTVAFALLISLIDAFTTAPMLSAYWYKAANKEPRGIAKIFSGLTAVWNRFYDRVNRLYKDILLWGLEHKMLVLIVTIALFLTSVFTLRFVGQNFMSSGDSGSLNINLESYPGAPLNQIDFYVRDIENYLMQQKDVSTFFVQVGNGGSHTAQLSVDMKEIGKRKLNTQEFISLLRGYIRKKFEKELNFRISESGGFMGLMTGGFGTPIQINVNGPDLQTLDKLSQTFVRIVKETKGTSDADTSMKPGLPEFVIRLDNIKAEKMGVTVLDVGNLLRDALSGVTISSYTVNDQSYDVVIRLDQQERMNIDQVRNMTLTAKNGAKIPLMAVATVDYSSSPLEIRREDKQRVVRITANLDKGYSLSEVVGKLKEKINASIVLPSGYTYTFKGQQQQFSDLVTQMLLAMTLSILFMYMILASLYNDFIQPFVLMLSIPLAIIGAFFALLLTGVDLDIYGYIGMLLVLGLVAKNAILLIDFTNKWREEGHSIRESLLHAGPVRLRPILMTSFAMIFGMLPLALGLNEGSRGRQALPTTVIGGILTSTFMTLVLVPAVYEWIEVRLERRRKKPVIVPVQGVPSAKGRARRK